MNDTGTGLPTAALRRSMRRTQTSGRLPSISVAIARRGQILWAEAVGLADVEAKRAATPETQYRIASITKTFTAAVTLLMADDGAFDLDDPLERYVPGTPFGRVTIRRLLAHTGGVQREAPTAMWETFQAPDRDGLLASLADAEQVGAPGSHWHYSNLGFGLLGELIARVAGAAYEQVVEKRLLRPLGLTRTTWHAAEPAARGYLVHPYQDTAIPQPAFDLRGKAAAGQLWSTTGDLGRWAMALSGGAPEILPVATVEAMHALQAMTDPKRWSEGWGLGLALWRRGELILAGHDGALPGFLAGFAFDRSSGVAAMALANAGRGMDQVALTCELAECAITAMPPDPGVWRPGAPCSDELSGVLGRWWSEGEETIFTWRGGRLEARRAKDPVDAPPSVFATEGPDRYRVVSGREHGEVLRVLRDGAGQVVKLLWATYPYLRSPLPVEPNPGSSW